MKKIKLTLAVAVFISGLVNLFFVSPTTYAYTCNYSGPNGDGTDGNGRRLEFESNTGRCIVMLPDDKDNDKRKPVFDSNGNYTGRDECTGGTVMHSDGNCWTYQAERTKYKPTYTNGNEVPREVWETACKNRGGGGSRYSDSEHGCDGDGILGNVSEAFDDQSNPKPPKYSDFKDSASCKNANGNFILTKKGANGSSDTWTCVDPKAPYSDYTNKDACDSVDGKFAMTQKGSNGSPDIWTCMSPKDYIESAKTKQECESRGGTWGTTTVAQNSASAGNSSCTAPAGTKDDPNQDPSNPDGSVAPMSPTNPPTTGNGQCGKAKTNIINCKGEGAQAFGDLLKQLLSLLTMGVGILAVGGILFGAIMYASAQDNAGQVQKAIGIITNTVIGLLLYIFMFAIANWLVPGGVIQ